MLIRFQGNSPGGQLSLGVADECKELYEFAGWNATSFQFDHYHKFGIPTAVEKEFENVRGGLVEFERITGHAVTETYEDYDEPRYAFSVCENGRWLCIDLLWLLSGVPATSFNQLLKCELPDSIWPNGV
jgi:hypothetical protein